MKRFLVFSGMDYYPSGGWRDFVGAFESLQKAKHKVEEIKNNGSCSNDWVHIVDLEINKICHSERIDW